MSRALGDSRVIDFIGWRDSIASGSRLRPVRLFRVQMLTLCRWPRGLASSSRTGAAYCQQLRVLNRCGRHRLVSFTVLIRPPRLHW